MENYAESRKPERGWPVADNQAVLQFFRSLLRERRRVFAMLVLLNGLAAATGLVVPRLLGDLINRTVDGDAESSLNALALLVVVVVCAQALLGSSSTALRKAVSAAEKSHLKNHCTCPETCCASERRGFARMALSAASCARGHMTRGSASPLIGAEANASARPAHANP